jgi:hypothetical protein
MFMSVAKQICESVPYIVVNYLRDIHKQLLKHVIMFSFAKHFTFLAKIYNVNFKLFGCIILCLDLRRFLNMTEVHTMRVSEKAVL